MNPNGLHEPTPEFRERLEWQIETALRRESRLAAPVTGGGLRRWQAALVVAVALATGGIAGIASERVQDARERDRLIESVRSDEGLARLRVDLARADLQETRRRFETGATGPESLEAAEQRLRDMETALARLRIDIEEIRATSVAPRNDLEAPLVGQRDFVRERIVLELESAQRALVATERALAQARGRVEVGMASPAVLMRAEADMSHARAEMQRLRATLDMRARALRGEIKGDELARALRRTELILQVDRAQRELEMARVRVERVRGLVEIGTAAPIDFKRAEVELLEREVELKRLREELRRLGAAGK
jgi:hypothetical protein